MEQQFGNAEPACDVIVVGGGLAGIYALIKLREKGLQALVLEAGSDLGGTWFWNRYPGARCDLESYDYSYSFSDDVQQNWTWTERYAAQNEILAYINFAADKFNVRDHVRFKVRVADATFDQISATWTIRTHDEQVFTSRFCVMATGNLSVPRLPKIEGLARFKGTLLHSAMWPAERQSFRGLRVGVVGTGSSGIQMIPIIAAEAAHLSVFQRTANFSVPARNSRHPQGADTSIKSDYPRRRMEARNTAFGTSGFVKPERSALEVDPLERDCIFEERWQQGGSIAFMTAFTDLLTNENANETASEFVRKKIRGIVRDKRVAEELCPKTHPIGTKRLCLDTGYYETFNRPNVTLVDLSKDPVETVTESGIQTRSEFYQLDVLVCATGFDAMTGALLEIDISVKDGVSLKQRWAEGPSTYLGILVAGIPNMFLITGPGSPSVKAQMVAAIEQHVDWVADCITTLDANGFRTVQAEPKAESDWTEHVDEVASRTLFPRADSWYTGANIEGKPRRFMPYVGGLDVYRRICDEVTRDGYRGLRFST